MSEEDSKIVCPYCGEEVDSKLSECPVCGAKLYEEIYICPRCTATITDKDQICPLCGVKLAKELSNIVIEGGNTYLITDENFTFRLFKTIISLAFKGLCLTKMNPQKIEKKHTLTGVNIYWLTTAQSKEKIIDPQRLDFELMYTVSEFIKNNAQSVILIDGLQLLITTNGIQKVSDFIKYISDLISTKESILLLPVTESMLTDSDYERVKEYTGLINYKDIQNEVTMNKEAGKIKVIMRRQNLPDKTTGKADDKSGKIQQEDRSSEAQVGAQKIKPEKEAEPGEDEDRGVGDMQGGGGSVRIKLRDSETGAVLEMELDSENTIDELIESAGAYWEKATGVYVIRKGNKILRGGMKIVDTNVRDGDIIELIPDPEGGI